MSSRERGTYHVLTVVVSVLALYQFYFIYTNFGALHTVTVAHLPHHAKLMENAEKWDNYLLMSIVPVASRHWYAYSQTEVSRLEELESDDPEVIDHIRKYKVVPQPPPFLLTQLKAQDMSRGQGPQMLNIFQNKLNGFFIDCGAYDGLTGSKTFLLERQFNWTGLMIEAEPNSFALAVEKKRNVFLVPACLSITTKPKMMSFEVGNIIASKIDATNKYERSVKVLCLPLYSILLAINRTTIDLFSLDVEGNELDVLMTIPFDKVEIKVFVIEWLHTRQGKQALRDFMFSKGYVLYPTKPADMSKWGDEDDIFIKKGTYKETRGD